MFSNESGQPAVTTEPVPANPKRKRISGRGQSSHYMSLASNIASLRVNSADRKAIGVCSTFRNEGSTTVATNLAQAITQTVDGKVLLVQADMDGNDLPRIFRTRNRSGWADVYLEECNVGDAINTTRHDRLFVMTAGDVTKRSILSYDAHDLSAILDVLKEEFEFIVFDLPVAHELSGCFALASVLDGTLLVIEADRVSASKAASTKGQLERFGANIVGAVVNKKRYYLPSFLRRS